MPQSVESRMASQSHIPSGRTSSSEPLTHAVDGTPDPANPSTSQDYDVTNGQSTQSASDASSRAPSGNQAENPVPGKPPVTPADAAKGARTGADLLRRLSLVGSSTPAPLPALADSEAAHPGLHLSGRIISAAFCIPYKASLRSGGDWELVHRPGTSALFDSFAHLASSQTPWFHTLVGWTGEVEWSRVPNEVPEHSPSSQRKPSPGPPATKASAPIPVDASVPQKLHFQPHEGVQVTEEDRLRLEERLRSSRFGRIRPVWLSEELDSSHQTMQLKDQVRWRRYAERELYPILHYKQHGPTDGRSERKWWADYVRLNKLFADRIMEVYSPGDIVWIHDYHLFLLPNFLRQKIPNIYIGFYLHAPFPSSEFLRCLAKRKDILTGVLGANMIGFQSFSYSRHFSSCCTRILGFDSSSAGVDAYGAHVAVDVFPIGIDVDVVHRVAYEDPVTAKSLEEIKNIHRGRKIIIGRDRLDSVRGVTQKLMAFETFLERYPEWQDKVVLIQLISPTSIEEAKEQSEAKLSTQMQHLSNNINGRYGSLNFYPLILHNEFLSQQDYFALLRAADVGLITSVRDGMSTTSLEYVVCQQDNKGPLILSEFSGTAGSLSNAIHINPWDKSGVADAIKQALTMSSEEKENQHSKLFNHITTHTVKAWSDQYVNRLLTNLSSFDQSIATPVLDKAKLLSQYRSARRRLFMFDYDGTLTPIVKDPQAAIPSDRVLRTIKTLAADPKNSVWIISGRDQGFLDEWMGHISELGLSAEHGCFIRRPGSEDWENLTESYDMGWQKDVVEIFQHYTERTQGSFIERKRVALTWHYRRVDPDYGSFQAKECRKLLENTVVKKWPVEVMAGKANLEVRPTFVNKGYIASRLVEEYRSNFGQPPDFVLCMGDDFTDEDMFRSLRHADLSNDRVFSVTVGARSKQTLASWHLLEPSDVVATIALLSSKTSVSDLSQTR